MMNSLPSTLVRDISRTYRSLCDAWWEDGKEHGLIDPPDIEVRLSIALYAMSHHRDKLPDGFEDWLEDKIIETLDEHGEVVADLLLASFTDEAIHGIPFLVRGGSC
jgi:hypothetical protein